MTKFEEEFKALTSWDWVNVDLIQQILTSFGNWHSDEEFQELLDKYSNLNDHYEKEVIRSSKLESQLISREKQVIELREADKAQGKEIIQLKSQLQQQALPVVPEDVDKAIKYLKTQNNFATFADFNDILTEKGLKWLNDFQFKDRRFGFGGLNNKLFILSHLAITGYKVEKPQLEDDVSIARDKCSSITAKKYIEHAIGTIKHDGHLGNIQTECILPYLEKALAAIGGHEK
ncbi:DUF1642 domain-containing protein [Lactococcus lactis]|uniref:DUF1642 domain-containing protein n=1 Tax=Lactococcus lactis TaxID=1358 RepID=UPI00288E08BC|nr:DUF1642 domain-containing protein [Lactococcus lactis]MDT2934088.1 DUF1642 domain-containing protein [Lactococcus lactis]